MKGLFSKENVELYKEDGILYTFDPTVLKKMKGFYEMEYMWYYIPSKEAGRKEVYVFGGNEEDSRRNLGILVNYWNRNDGYFKYTFLHQLEGGLSIENSREYTKEEMITHFKGLMNKSIKQSMEGDTVDETYHGGVVDAYRNVINFLKKNKIKE